MTEELKIERFPANGDSGELQVDQTNPAIRLYGRRFYKDQTPVEYLAEFLLVFASAKQENGEGCYQFNLPTDDNKPCYWPEDRIALKLFSFFPSSKLETRHPVHQQAYLDALNTLKEHISGTNEEQEEAVRLLQSLFNGFAGVAKNRTWVTYSFLPVTNGLLARELNWLHSKAKKDKALTNWESAASYSYFAHDRHNFMARGGELLYLQIANLFSQENSTEIHNLLSGKEYQHLSKRMPELSFKLKKHLHSILQESVEQLSCLANLVESVLDEYKIKSEPKPNYFGWVPVASRIEGLLFAMEMDNICSSNLGTLDKLDLLQTLCCMQVLRSLCFQARRIDEAENNTLGFYGNYVWVVSDTEANVGTLMRRMAEISFQRIEDLLYRVLKKYEISGVGSHTEAVKHGFQIFRKISKEIGLVVPRRGSGQRFTLHQGLLRFLVAALVSPNERIRLTHFYQRVFAHYGIALGGEQLTVALNWCSNETEGGDYAVSSSTAWVEEALQQGGFLVELSDAVSMVKHPG